MPYKQLSLVAENDEQLPLSPPLKWAGGKRWLLPILRKFWRAQGEGTRLVEPFCGGLSIALGLIPSRALLNDINPHLINFYRWVQQGLSIALEMRNDSVQYYAHRNRFNNLIANEVSDTSEAASLFYYLNRTCYNGLCRFNSKGYFNVPFGQHKTIAYMRDFSVHAKTMRNWDFSIGDFQLIQARAQDFLYVDPPYDNAFAQYSARPFTWSDQVRLVEWLCSHRGPVVASNHATERTLELYKSAGFQIEIVRGPRSISRTGDRSSASELLASRGLPQRSAVED